MIAAEITRMKNILLTISCTLLICTITYGQNAPAIEWQKSFGGTHGDYSYSIVQISDSSYYVAGDSYSTNGNVTDHHGSNSYADAWITKLSANGSLIWAKSFGGTASDGFFDVEKTTDGGCIAAGYSYSNDGDVNAHHGTTSSSDFWVVKVDSNGIVVWEKSLGGSMDEKAEGILVASDSGFVVAGYSKSVDGDLTGNYGGADYWVVRIDDYGNLLWQLNLGGSSLDWAKEIIEDASGSFIVAGYSDSDDGDIDDHHGNAGIGDFWIVRLDATGTKLWAKSFGGSNTEQAQSLVQSVTGDVIVVGEAKSTNGDVSGLIGGKDFWLISVDLSGALLWQKCYGGTKDERAYSIQETIDGGFIISGDSYSNDFQVTGHHGSTSYNDFWVARINQNGFFTWGNSYGGSTGDNSFSILQTFDGGFITTGWCNSDDGDVTGHQGLNSVSDFWIVKTLPEIFYCSDTSPCEKFCIDFNDTSNSNPTSWQWNFEGGNPSASTEENPVSICYDLPGMYDVTLITISANGIDTFFKPDYITVNPMPPVPDITPAGNTLISSTADFYQWQFNTVDIPGATNQSYEATQSGYYTIVTSDMNGCKNSASWNIVITGFENISSDQYISITPNPASDQFTVYLQLNGNINEAATIEVINLLGQVVYNKTSVLLKGKLEETIDLNDEADGIYIVRVKVDEQLYSGLIVFDKQ